MISYTLVVSMLYDYFTLKLDLALGAAGFAAGALAVARGLGLAVAIVM